MAGNDHGTAFDLTMRTNRIIVRIIEATKMQWPNVDKSSAEQPTKSITQNHRGNQKLVIVMNNRPQRISIASKYLERRICAHDALRVDSSLSGPINAPKPIKKSTLLITFHTSGRTYHPRMNPSRAKRIAPGIDPGLA
jgi:hypothetical protein